MDLDWKSCGLRQIFRLTFTYEATSLPNAKPAENSVEQVIGVDGAHHFAELVECFPELQGEQLRRFFLGDDSLRCHEVVQAFGHVMAAAAEAGGQGGLLAVSGELGEYLFQLRQAFTIDGAGRKKTWMRRSLVALRGNGNDGPVWSLGEDVLILLRQAFSCLNAEQHRIRLPLLHSAQLLGLELDLVFRLVSPGGIDQLHDDVAQAEDSHQVVAGGARMGAYDGAWRAEQGIEETALAGIGPAGEHRAERPGGAAAGIELEGQFLKMRMGRGQATQKLGPLDKFDILLDEVKGRLDVGEQVEQIVAEPFQRSGHAAGQLLEGSGQLGTIAGFKDCQDRFGAREVKLAGKERTQGKFAGLGRPSSGIHQVGDEDFDQGRTGE